MPLVSEIMSYLISSAYMNILSLRSLSVMNNLVQAVPRLRISTYNVAVARAAFVTSLLQGPIQGISHTFKAVYGTDPGYLSSHLIPMGLAYSICSSGKGPAIDPIC